MGKWEIMGKNNGKILRSFDQESLLYALQCREKLSDELLVLSE